MTAAVTLRTDFSAIALRRLARHSKDAHQSRRLLSLAAVRDGMNRTDAARIGGMDRHTLFSTGVTVGRNFRISVFSHRTIPLISTANTDSAIRLSPNCALTVALLDQFAPLVRNELGVSTQGFPLAGVLQGGTWSAGRRIAREKRADGSPPVRIVSDGATF